MNKRVVLIFALVLPAARIASWQETRTPLSLFEGYMHYPLDRDRELNDYNVDVHFWTGIYFRTATHAFGNGCATDNLCSNNTATIITTTRGQVTLPNACCPSSCDPRNKESLASLYFGQSTFTFEQAFAYASIPQGSSINPFVILTPVTFNVDYREQGVWFGTTLSGRFGCNKQWNTGVRIRAPFRDIRVQQLGQNSLANTTAASSVEDLYQQRVESIQVGNNPAVTQNVFAVRLDALEALNRINFNVNGVTVPMVSYPATDILIAGQNASGGVPTVGPVSNLAPFLGIIESANGALPTTVRWADVPSKSATVVAGDGSGLSNLERGRIASDISYATLASNIPAQSHLYVVPNVQDVGASTPGALIGSANTVYTTLSTAFNNLTGSSINDFAQQVGLNGSYGTTSGLGDLNFEFFLGHDWKDWGYLEGRLWLTAPTGVKVKNPLNILKFPTGNNGHAEVGLGIAGGIEKLRYITCNFDAYYIWVAPARNNVAAPFTGATVKNIGPCVPGETSWQYGIIDLNVNFINPYCECMGLMIGYEAYLKGRDTLKLCATDAIDWVGNLEPLAASVYTANSDRIANRIRTETFFSGECMTTFLGFEATVSGKNIPAEVDFHIGLDVYF